MQHKPHLLNDTQELIDSEAPQAMSPARAASLVSPPDDILRDATRYVIGVDIGGTSLRLALANGAGRILGRWSASTAGTGDAATILRLMRDGVDALLREASLPSHSLSAIAAGAPGVTNADEGIVIATSYLMGWRDVPFRHMLETEFGIPAFVDNDVNVAAIGELRAGLAQGTTDFVFLAIGTGIGAGIVLNNEVHRGGIWTAGEIGYMLVPGTSDAPVERGQPGALESLVGGEGIRQQWRSVWSDKSTSLPIDATATQVFDQALKGDALAKGVLDRTARALSYAIHNIALVLNSPLFVLGGSVGIHPALGDATRVILLERGTRAQPRLVSSALGADAQLIGAIFLALDTADRDLVNKETAATQSTLA
jgi:glucokinase